MRRLNGVPPLQDASAMIARRESVVRIRVASLRGRVKEVGDGQGLVEGCPWTGILRVLGRFVWIDVLSVVVYMGRLVQMSFQGGSWRRELNVGRRCRGTGRALAVSRQVKRTGGQSSKF